MDVKKSLSVGCTHFAILGYDDSFMCICDLKGDDVMQSIGVDM